MKKVLFILALILMPMISFAQNDAEKKQTKFEEFTSKTGRIQRFEDVRMPSIALRYGAPLECSIRIVGNGDSKKYFYRIEKPETQSSVSRIAMIEYSDLVEINKAAAQLMSDVESDIANNPDYLENRFITEDGMQFGYFVSKGSATWYFKLERYSNSTVFVKNIDSTITALKDAQAKIEELNH